MPWFLALLSGVLCVAALTCTGNLLLLALLLLGLGWAFNLNNAAIGGWFSELDSEEEKGRLGAWLLFFLIMPAASFAVGNNLTGLGRDFGASEAFVGAICGIGVALAGIIASLAIPPLARRMPVERLCLLVGAVSAGFSLLLIWLPRLPVSYAIAVIGQNGFWAASYSAIAPRQAYRPPTCSSSTDTPTPLGI